MTIQDKIDAAREQGFEVTVTHMAPDWHECRCGEEVRSFAAGGLLRGEFEAWLDTLPRRKKAEPPAEPPAEPKPKKARSK